MMKHAKDAVERAKAAFADHTIEVRQATTMCRLWHCQKPKTWMYGFHVMTWPGTLVLSGDIGFLAVEREADMIAWARSAVIDAQYFAGKVPPGLRESLYEFDEDAFKAHVRSLLERGQLTGDGAKRIKDREEFGQHALMLALYEETGDSADMPSCRQYTFQYLFQLEAMKWFLARI